MQANADFRPARRAWLVLIALGHLAVLLAWRPVARHGGEPNVRPEGELVFLTQPPAARPPPPEPAPRAPRPLQATAARPAPPPVASAVVRPEAPAAASESAPQTITLPAPAAGEPLDPFARPAPLAETSLEKNRKLAAGVDRQLRKESLNKFATIVLPDTKLGMAIAKAQTKDWVLEQTSDLGDGVTMKRYRKGNQEYCEYTNLVGARGQDPGRDWNKTKVMTCP